MKKLITVALAGALLGAAPPPPKLNVERHVLGNGLTLLMSPDHTLPLVTVEVRYLVGSAHERPGRSGFAHLFEHLMFQGSQSFDDEYFKPFEPIGGAVNGTTNTDRTNYFERVPKNYLELALWMESDRMQGLLPALTQEKLDNQRDVVKNERRQRYENPPYGMVWKYLAEGLYPDGHPYRHWTIGSHEDLSAASLDDVKSFFREYYAPSNAIVTIVGDFEPQQAQSMVRQYFGAMQPGKRAATPTASPVELTEAKHVTHTDNVKLPRIYMAWHTPALFAAGDAEMDVLAGVLTRGKTSRLYRPLVYEKKVAKDVRAFQSSRQLGSSFVVQATAAPGVKLKDLEKELRAALEKALATPPTDDEMKRVVNGWRKSFYGRVESVISRATLLSTYYHFTGEADYLAKDLERYTKLSAQDVHASTKKHIKLDRYLRIDIVPEAKP